MQRFTAAAAATTPPFAWPACLAAIFLCSFAVSHPCLAHNFMLNMSAVTCGGAPTIAPVVPQSPPPPAASYPQCMQLTVTLRILSVSISASTAHAIFKLRPYRPLTWPTAMAMIRAKLHKFCNSSNSKKTVPKRCQVK